MTIKNESIIEFLSKNLIGFKPGKSHDHTGEENPYYLMKDEMYLRKGDYGNTIEIQLKDKSNGSNKSLVNNYTYRTESYDGVSVKLVLIDFSITTN